MILQQLYTQHCIQLWSDVTFVTALVSSVMACLASSPGISGCTARHWADVSTVGHRMQCTRLLSSWQACITSRQPSPSLGSGVVIIDAYQLSPAGSLSQAMASLSLFPCILSTIIPYSVQLGGEALRAFLVNKMPGDRDRQAIA